MEPAEFAQRLSALTGAEITALATRLRHELDSADGELSWWRATVTVGANLQRHHRSREAGIAPHRATTAVLEASDAAMPAPARDDVTVVARGASEVARLLVA